MLLEKIKTKSPNPTQTNVSSERQLYCFTLYFPAPQFALSLSGNGKGL